MPIVINISNNNNSEIETRPRKRNMARVGLVMYLAIVHWPLAISHPTDLPENTLLLARGRWQRSARARPTCAARRVRRKRALEVVAGHIAADCYPCEVERGQDASELVII